MNRTQAQEIWFLIKAFGETGVIQKIENGIDKTWFDKEEIDICHLIMFHQMYRVKPEPEEIWINKTLCGKEHVHATEDAALEVARTYEPTYEYIARRFVESL